MLAKLIVFVITSGVMSGASWREIDTGLPGSAVGVIDLTIDPTNPSTIYARTDTAHGGAIFKSMDGGGSWTAISGIAGVSSLAIDPTNSSTIYAGAGQGVVKSTNGGESWTSANTGLPSGSAGVLAVDPITSSTLYTATFGGIFKSTNGGGNWSGMNTLPSNSFIQSLSIDPLSPSTIYAVLNGAGGMGILKTMDGGASWNAIHSSLSDANTGVPCIICPLAIDPTTPSTIYAAGFGIVKSADGGQSWKAVNTGIPTPVRPSGLSPGIPFPSLASIVSLSIDPITPSTIYAAYAVFGSGGVVKSTNGGTSWSVIGTPSNTSSGRGVQPGVSQPLIW